MSLNELPTAGSFVYGPIDPRNDKVFLSGKALERERKAARDMLKRVMPYDVWIALRQPDPHERALYWRIVEELRVMAE